MLEATGMPTREDLQTKMPSPERLARGPVAMIECFQKIPCDPCYHSCPKKAICELVDINDIPTVDFDKCTGCALCINNCPGLAIFVLDQNYDDEHALVRMPYEFIPRPQIGEIVAVLNREGQEIGEGKIAEVRDTKVQDKTAVVGVAIAKELIMEVRNIRLRGSK